MPYYPPASPTGTKSLPARHRWVAPVLATKLTRVSLKRKIIQDTVISARWREAMRLQALQKTNLV